MLLHELFETTHRPKVSGRLVKKKLKVKQKRHRKRVKQVADEDLWDNIKSTFGDIAQKGGEYVAGQVLSKISTGGV